MVILLFFIVVMVYIRIGFLIFKVLSMNYKFWIIKFVLECSLFLKWYIELFFKNWLYFLFYYESCFKLKGSGIECLLVCKVYVYVYIEESL